MAERDFVPGWFTHGLTRRRFGSALAAGAAWLAKGPAGPSRSAAAGPAADDDGTIRSAVEVTMATFGRMQSTGDETLVSQVLDPRAAALRRIVTEQAQRWARLAEQGAQRPVAYRVRAVRPAPNGYYKADLGVLLPAWQDQGAKSAAATFVFRHVDDRWLLSEPLEPELGERRWLTTDHFRVRY